MITKGTPQGSVMGPFMYNMFTNDLLFMMEKVQNCSILNYIYDNTISAFHSIFVDFDTILKQSCNLIINWINDNLMQANPTKFQCIPCTIVMHKCMHAPLINGPTTYNTVMKHL